MPQDLDYFIQFELDDRADKNRQSHVVPATADYKDYQISQGKASAKDIGALYKPAFLEDYAPGGQRTDDHMGMLSELRSWHGNSMGTACQSILILGGPRECVLKKETRVQLETIKHLYFFNPGLRRHGLSSAQSDDQNKRLWPHEDDDGHDEQRKLKGDKWEED